MKAFITDFFIWILPASLITICALVIIDAIMYCIFDTSIGFGDAVIKITTGK